MINPLPIRIRYDRMEMFEDVPNVSYDAEADITINDVEQGRYNILFYPENPPSSELAIFVDEIWVETLEEKITQEKSGVKRTVIVLTTDESLLPYAMKDRLAYLQDKINKEKGRYQ